MSPQFSVTFMECIDIYCYYIINIFIKIYALGYFVK